MKKLNVVTNYIYNTAYQFLNLLAPLITAPYISRVLGAQGVGIYSYAQSIATYFVLIGAVGTSIYGQREVAYVQDDPEKRSQLFWQITIFRFCTVFICTVFYFFTFGIHGEYSMVSQILTIEVAATALDVSWFFGGMENFRVTALRNIVMRLLGIVLIFALVKTKSDLPVYAFCMTAPMVIGNASLWISLPKHLVKVKVDLKGILKHLKPALLLFVPQLAIEIYTVLDKTMLGIFGSDMAQVGYYNQAERTVRISLQLITSLGTVMLPAMSFAFAKGEMETVKKSIRQSFRFVFMIGFAMLFGIAAVADRFVPLFFGDGFTPVSYLMMLLSPILILSGTSNVIGHQYLLPTKQQTAYAISVITGTVVNFILNIILITKYDAVGAALATVLAELSVTLMQIFFTRKQLDFKACFAPALKYLICGVIMGLFVYGMGFLFDAGWGTLILQIFAGVVIYLVELIITKDALLRMGFHRVVARIKEKNLS